MEIEVLGCCSGFCAHSSGTSSLLVDTNHVLDCGSGLHNLELARLQKINSVTITHSHLDHILFLPLLVDMNYPLYEKSPLQVYGPVETIKILKEHIFNDKIWPDFTKIPSKDSPAVELIPLEFNTPIELQNYGLELIEVNHTVPAAAIKLTSDNGKSLLFSGDTASNKNIWRSLEKDPNIKALVVECTFVDEQFQLAELSKHYCPKTLAADINNRNRSDCDVYLTHMRVGQEERLLSELKQQCNKKNISYLKQGKIIKI